MIPKISGASPSNCSYPSKQNPNFTSVYTPYADCWQDLASNTDAAVYIRHEVNNAQSKLGLWLLDPLIQSISGKFRPKNRKAVVLTEENVKEFNKLKTIEDKKTYLNQFLNKLNINLDEKSKFETGNIEEIVSKDDYYTDDLKQILSRKFSE